MLAFANNYIMAAEKPRISISIAEWPPYLMLKWEGGERSQLARISTISVGLTSRGNPRLKFAADRWHFQLWDLVLIFSYWLKTFVLIQQRGYKTKLYLTQNGVSFMH